MRMSLYVDNVVLFIRSEATNISNMQRLLHRFGEATGLMINMEKSEIFPRHCDDMNIDVVLG